MLLENNPKKLLLKFKSIAETILDKKTKTIYLAEIDSFLKTNKTPITTEGKWQSYPFSRSILGVITQRLITFSWKLFPFHIYNPIPNENYEAQKFFLPASDGTILDGLLIKNKKQSTRTIVLALVGHFQAEHSYLSGDFIQFQELFCSDIVFLHHRNYSLRAQSRAKKIEELANDVVAFVHYFRKQKKEIVLYGMCGGAAHMIVAADLLRQKKIPFKLIVDRFFTKYSNFIDLTTFYRRIKQEPPESTLSLFPLIGAAFLLVRFALFITRSNVNFGEKIRLLPENDVLVLQGKSKKRSGEKEPQFTDLIVHPKNDIRFCLKERRRHQKNILKNLAENCCRLSDLQFQDKTHFLHLEYFFEKALELIDNEKLRGRIAFKKVKDIHSTKLYDLKTRHDVSLPAFLGSFFSKPTQTCEPTLSKIIVYPFEIIIQALNILQPKHSDNLDIARLLSDFLNELKQHEAFICHIGNRLFKIGQVHLNDRLEFLLESLLFKTIKKLGWCQVSLIT